MICGQLLTLVNLLLEAIPDLHLRLDANRAWHRSRYFFNLLSHRVDIRQHSAGNFNADGAFNAG